MQIWEVLGRVAECEFLVAALRKRALKNEGGINACGRVMAVTEGREWETVELQSFT